MNNTKKVDDQQAYRFSFTAANLMTGNMIRLAEVLVQKEMNWSDMTFEHLGKERERTNQREFRELKYRLKNLSRQELEYLLDATPEGQGHICLIAFARTYRFFYDLMLELIWEKVLMYDLDLTDRDYLAYYRKKALDHEELEAFTESTQKKARQVIFHVLVQGGLLDAADSRRIIRPIIDLRLENILKAQNPGDLKLLLQSA